MRKNLGGSSQLQKYPPLARTGRVGEKRVELLAASKEARANRVDRNAKNGGDLLTCLTTEVVTDDCVAKRLGKSGKSCAEFARALGADEERFCVLFRFSPNERVLGGKLRDDFTGARAAYPIGRGEILHHRPEPTENRFFEFWPERATAQIRPNDSLLTKFFCFFSVAREPQRMDGKALYGYAIKSAKCSRIFRDTGKIVLNHVLPFAFVPDTPFKSEYGLTFGMAGNSALLRKGRETRSS